MNLMNLMKKTWPLIVLCMLLSACSAHSPIDSAAPLDEPLVKMADERTSGVIFTYNGKDYDLQERSPSVNALMAETTVGSVIVVEGHIGPKHGYYGVFDTKTEMFVKDIEGANLTWREDDIFTAAYSVWSEIYGYDGTLLADLDLSESEYISGLSWKDSRHLSVEIRSADSEAQDTWEIAVGDELAPAEEIQENSEP